MLEAGADLSDVGLAFVLVEDEICGSRSFDEVAADEEVRHDYRDVGAFLVTSFCTNNTRSSGFCAKTGHLRRGRRRPRWRGNCVACAESTPLCKNPE